MNVTAAGLLSVHLTSILIRQDNGQNALREERSTWLEQGQVTPN